MFNTTVAAVAEPSMLGSWSGVQLPFQLGLDCDQGFLMLDTSFRLFEYLRRDQRHPIDSSDQMMVVQGAKLDDVTEMMPNGVAEKFTQSQRVNAHNESATPSKISGTFDLSKPVKEPQETHEPSQGSKPERAIEVQSLFFSIDIENLDLAAYLGVLIFVNLFYLSLMILLTWIVVYVRNQSRLAPDNSLSRQISDRVFISSYIFLQLTLLCKLAVAVLILLHVCGFASHELPVPAIKLLYHASGLFLCIAYFITLYQWLFIAMRVNLYGGKFGVRDFRKRVMKSQRASCSSSFVIFTATFTLILVEVFTHLEQVSQAVSMLEVVQFASLLICFTITGPIIIRNLWVYFDKSYNKQRYTLLAALLLTILSLLVLSLRYTLEFVYNGQGLQIGEGTSDPAKAYISVTACLVVILVSDLLPIITQMLCIWISSKGRWDSLMSGFLSKRIEHDDSTYAGSVMLESLRAELFTNDTLILCSSEESFQQQYESFDSDWQSIKSVADAIPDYSGLQSSNRS